MADGRTKEQISRNMSRVRGKDTKPEVAVRKYLFSKGFRFRKNDSRLPGKPDVVLPKYRTVIFVNGCFWHAHEGCRRASVPESHREYWEAKLRRNKERDAEVERELRNAGWKVLTVWECGLKKSSFESVLDALIEAIRSESPEKTEFP